MKPTSSDPQAIKEDLFHPKLGNENIATKISSLISRSLI